LVTFMNKDYLYGKAIALWGIDAQVWVFIEEFGELLQSFGHIKRRRPTNLIEELADVQIMLDQLIFYYFDGRDVTKLYEDCYVELMGIDDQVWSFVTSVGNLLHSLRRGITPNIEMDLINTRLILETLVVYFGKDSVNDVVDQKLKRLEQIIRSFHE